MKNRKLQLNDIRVQSFVTEFNEKEAITAKGGIQAFIQESTPQGCSWSANDGCTGAGTCYTDCGGLLCRK